MSSSREQLNYEFNKERVMEQGLKDMELRIYLQVIFLLFIFTLMWGCGNGGSMSNDVVSKNAISISPISSSEYVLRGDNMDGVAGIDLTIDYDNATLSSPTVAQGELISGAMMATNTTIPGKIRIAIVSTRPLAGNGLIATVSFAAITGIGDISITSINMIDTKGASIL